MRRPRTYLSSLALLLASAVVRGGDGTNDEWLRLIGKDLGGACPVELVRVEAVVAGNNGYREEKWFLKSCGGDVKYLVEFFPPTFFPARPSPYAVRRIVLELKSD